MAGPHLCSQWRWEAYIRRVPSPPVAKADLGERRRRLLTVLDAVYVDTRGAIATVTIRPKALFELVFTEADSLTPSR